MKNKLNRTKWKPHPRTPFYSHLVYATIKMGHFLFAQEIGKGNSVLWSARHDSWALIWKFMLNKHIMSNIIPRKLENNSTNGGEEHLSKEHKCLWFLLEAAELGIRQVVTSAQPVYALTDKLGSAGCEGERQGLTGERLREKYKMREKRRQRPPSHPSKPNFSQGLFIDV